MLSKETFEKCMWTLLQFHGIEANEERQKLFYNLFKNDFEDAEFADICGQICREENLFGKYPIPPMFYSRKREDTSNQVLIVEGQFYLDDTIPEYRPYLAGVSSDDQEKIWKWLIKNRYGEYVSKDWIIERIKQFVGDRYKQQAIESSEFSDSQIEDMIHSSIRRLN